MPDIDLLTLPGKQFTRLFRIFDRIFPGAQLGQPNAVSQHIQMVAEVLKPSLAHDVRLQADTQSQATGGGGSIVLTHVEPSAGFIQIPVSYSVFYDAPVTAVDVTIGIALSANVPDVWGRWPSTDFISVRSVNGRYTGVPVFPIPRGNQFTSTFAGTAGALNVRSRLYWLEVPAELVSLELWRAHFGNFTNNTVM